MLVLGIESTCDETACAIVKDGNQVLSNCIASQIELHSDYGGVVPELACRRHIDLIMPIIDQSIKHAQVNLKDIDLIAVAHGPGLIGSLMIGLNTAKALSMALNKPFVGVNHVEAHLYAALMSREKPVKFPCLGVVLSGGHTNLVLMKDIGHYQSIGQTVDDAIGEAFDKVAKLLGLEYPGGPLIEQLALRGDSKRFPFKAGNVKAYPLHFSFSGLKTAVLYTLKKPPFYDEMTQKSFLTECDKCDLAASFQSVAFEDVVKKTQIAAEYYQVQTIVFGGGVTNNQYLRKLFKDKTANRYELLWPSLGLSLDNAAMIGGLGYHTFRAKGKGDDFTLEPLVRISFASE